MHFIQREAQNFSKHAPPCMFLAVAFVFSIFVAQLPAQPDRGYIMQTVPYPVYATPEQANYNLKFGRMIARINGGVQFEFNDNIGLGLQERQSDLSIGPTLDFGFMIPYSREHILQLDLGIGYRWYLNHPAVSSLSLAPRSRVDYRGYAGNVQFNLHDAFQIQSDPVQRPEVFGAPEKVMRFRRFNNTIGAIAEWRPVRRLGITFGYDYAIDRSMTGQFKDLDYDGHTFSLGAFYTASSKLVLGLNNSYSMTIYRQNIQNDGWAYTIGPVISYQLTRFISLDAAAGYTTSQFDQTGTIGDTSGFSSITFQTGLRHRVNSRTTQSLRVGRALGVGYGSNYTETWGFQYNLNTRVHRAVSLNTMFSYSHFRASRGDSGDAYQLYFGTGYQLTKRWNVGIGYSYSWKTSDLGRDYEQNRLTLDFRRQF